MASKVTGAAREGADGPPRTDALRQALRTCDTLVAADLRFLESWEIDPTPGLGTALRVGQIRRAHPALAAAIRAEIADHSRRHRLAPPPG